MSPDDDTRDAGPSALAWPHCRNVRDLGGVALRDGTVRSGALVRSDNLDQLTPVGLSALHASGVRRVVDLRSSWECQRYPSPVAGEPIWLNVPLSDADDPDESHLDLAAQYCRSLDRAPERVAAVIAAVAGAPPGCVVICCHAGKDRTGVMVALILGTLGATDAAIASDYATFGAGVRSSRDDPASATLPELQLPQAETMLTTLHHLRIRYGSVTEYLVAAGSTAQHLDRLAERLLAPRSSD